MKKFQRLLTAVAVLLCSLSHSYAKIHNFDDWTSSNHGDSSSDSEEYSFTLASEGTLSFDWSVSCEDVYDKFIVTLDGNELLNVSGEQNGKFERSVMPGDHVLMFKYTKDGSGSNGEDRAFVSNIYVNERDIAIIDSISYESNSDNTVSVVSVADTTIVEIPNKVVINGVEYVVNEILPTAFKDCVSLNSVSIPESVTEIKSGTFVGCVNLVKVVLPSKLTTKLTAIGDNAFLNCSKLSEITIPVSVTSIGYSAFKGCVGLESISVPEGVTELKSETFSECANLVKVVLPSKLTTIGDNAFLNCSKLSKFTIPASVTSIGYSAFKNCVSFDTIAVPEGVTELKSETFAECSDLATVVLPSNLSAIGDNAFIRCSKISNLTIPASVTSIGYAAFKHCVSLDSISIPNGVTQISRETFYGCTKLSKVSIPNSITRIGESAFYNCGNIESIVIPENVTYIGNNAFNGCGGELTINSDFDFYSDSWNSPFYNSKFTKVTFCEGITEIKNYAFENSNLLSEVVLPTTLTKIGECAFSETRLSSIELPASVSYIGYGAFPYSMSKMTCKSQVPPTLGVSSEGYNFSLGNISIVYVPEGYASAYKSVNPWASVVVVDGSGVSVEVKVTPGMMGEEILSHVNYLSDVNFLTLSGSINTEDIANIKNSMPNLLSIDMSGLDMKNIPSDMFTDRKALLSIILPKNVETIGSGSFMNCINLESIVLPEGLKVIENGRYSYEYVSTGAFYGCTSLKSVSFPSTLESIGGMAFYRCSALKEIVFDGKLNRIGGRAFAECINLSKVDFNKGLEIIEDKAFCNCYNLGAINFDKGLKSICEGAFEGCSSLKEIEFPSTLKSLSTAAFHNCSKLEKVVFTGALDVIGSTYDYNDSYDYNYYGIFENCTSLKQVEFHEGLKSIGSNTFRGCRSLTAVKIPEGVTNIYKNAFKGCSNLTELTLPSTLTLCSSAPFAGCVKLSKVTCMALLPPSLTDGLLTLEDMGLALKRTLYVPGWTLNKYKLTSGWAAFKEILAMDEKEYKYPETITVTTNATLSLPTKGLPTDYKPNLEIIASQQSDGGDIYYPTSSSLHFVSKNATESLALSKFKIDYNENLPGVSTSGLYSTRHQLLNDITISADTVVVKMYLYRGYSDDYNSNYNGWHFLSFPFDIKVSDIKTNNSWVIRQYDGKARAANKLSSTWVNVPYDGTLKAGQGYIWASEGGYFDIQAIDNENKNLIFANTKRKIALQEYPSDVVSNSGWNLVGNPYPCYYNTKEMDFTAPITVWKGGTYAAYSPVDDNYVLSPFEAFFVQCPAGVDSIGFKPEGRQLSSQPTTVANAHSRTYNETTNRMVVNLTLSGDRGADRTRFVINEAAKMDYELSCDAAKFMSTDAAMPQLYTVCGDDKYSINERPMADGIVKLGTYFGSNGIYTIAMESFNEMSVVLVDLKTGTETDLSQEDYTFQAEMADLSRFELHLFDKEQTSVNTVKTNVKVASTATGVVVTGAGDANVELYNVAGALVATDNGENVAFDVPQGVYVVKVNNISYKIVVAK